MTVTVGTIVKRFEESYPLWMAEANDPNGLHFGSLDNEVKKVMITLDVRPDVVQEAIEKKIDLIIAKHPPIFSPIKRLTDETVQTKMYNEIIRNNINIYAAHTNIDIAPNGLNDWLLEELDCKVIDYLSLVHQIPYEMFTINVDIYEEKKTEIVQSLKKLKDCQLLTVNPVINGIVSPKAKKNMLQLLHKDYSFSQQNIIWQSLSEGPFQEYGIGRVGMLSQPLTLTALSDLIKEKYQMDHVKLITKNPQVKVQKVAICSGSGQKFYHDALAKQADVYITGDVYYHVGHDMYDDNLNVIDAGHYIEHLVKLKLASLMRQWAKEQAWDIDIEQSQVNTNPFRVY